MEHISIFTISKLFPFLLLSLTLSVSGCKNVNSLHKPKQLNRKQNIKERAIQIVIDDCIKKNKVVKFDKAYLYIEDHGSVLEIAVSPFSVVPQMYSYEEYAEKIGHLIELEPTRYCEKEGRLFYWEDERYPVTQELIQAFLRYDLMYYAHEEYEKGGFIIYDGPNWEYYFCKINLRKKIIKYRMCMCKDDIIRPKWWNVCK